MDGKTREIGLNILFGVGNNKGKETKCQRLTEVIPWRLLSDTYTRPIGNNDNQSTVTDFTLTVAFTFLFQDQMQVRQTFSLMMIYCGTRSLIHFHIFRSNSQFYTRIV